MQHHLGNLIWNKKQLKFINVAMRDMETKLCSIPILENDYPI